MSPLIVLGIEPLDEVSVQNFFSEENNPLYDLLKNPPYLRYSGWNLLTLDTPRIKDGKCWEVKNGDRKTIRFYKNGSLVAIAYADDSFLGWGKDHDEFVKIPQLNSMAIIEYIYEFVNLYKNFLAHFPDLKKIRIGIGIKNVDTWEGKKLLLRPQRVDALFYRIESENFEVYKLTHDFYESITSKVDYEPKYLAYELVSQLFIQFGISPDKIPYTKRDTKGFGYIDIEDISANK